MSANDQKEPDNLTYLDEKDFIQDKEHTPKNPYPVWILLGIFTALVAIAWMSKSWLLNYRQDQIAAGPFLQVSNRDFSSFLWNNTQFMRSNVSSKTGYLPDFQYLDKVTVEPDGADKYVSAPPEVLFLYHTWNRLLSNEFTPRVITPAQFSTFLKYAEEWNPENWQKAPEGYKALVKGLASSTEKNLALLPPTILPTEVQRAFVGWKNYTLEASEIDNLQITLGGMREFLQKYPHYARNYWINIVKKNLPNYLKTVDASDKEPSTILSRDETSGFLRQAYFNYQKSSQGH